MFYYGKVSIRLGWVSSEWRSISIRGTRRVPVPESGEPNIQGARMERFLYPSVR